MFWGHPWPCRDLLSLGTAPAGGQGNTGAGQAGSPRGHASVEPNCEGGGVHDARSGAESHIWAQSRLLEAGPRQAADNPPDSGSQGASAAPIGSCQRGLPIYPPPRRGAASGTGGRMVPARALGLLLCVQLCGGSGELRLVDGGGRCAGRVEVKHEGEWGSVCSYDFDWDHRGAGVVCRQLGCGAVARASPYAPFGQGKGRIWLHPIFCNSTEANLHDCFHFGWGKHFCSHEWDVGVTCTGKGGWWYWGCRARTPRTGLRLVPGTEALELRLAAGRGPCEGRVEVKLRGRWGTVADDEWDMEDAEVVCQQMGCGSAAGAYQGSQFGQRDDPISLAFINCDGNEKALWDCKIQGWGPYTSPTKYDSAVVCKGKSWGHAALQGAPSSATAPGALLSWQGSPV
ncbi:scavenger receptor cysteine-rich type 1 protein M130-like [Anser cygnoides]|uniref:scavenger receptor cysteine-rich type 1 protein M130-like n=1 Tax=Anser cygnoides TaxID=8845 RepID=UPI0034D2238A